jgi:phosphoenolpyruvate carboxykinase (ATP)
MGNNEHAAIHRLVEGGASEVSRNEVEPVLIARALCNGDAELTIEGALSVRTGAFTGRSPRDKFIVRDHVTEDRVWWENVSAMSPEHFELLLSDAVASLRETTVFRQDLIAGADPLHQYGVTVLTPSAWHALFIRNLLIRPGGGTELSAGSIPVTIVHAPLFRPSPSRHGCRTDTVVSLDMRRNIVVIAGTLYAGEIKKSVFSLFNFHAPASGVLPMHCSANIGPAGDSALFFGLSGTGKTTLSSDPVRALIGDDEHGWGPNGIFNLEGGCYAKTIKLDAEEEPEIHAATGRFGTVLENVVLDEAKRPDFDDGSITENTRAAYPLSVLPRIAHGVCGHPGTVVLLTADAFGVLPPIAKLTPEQAVYHFLSGYTAKVAGTERGITEPQATFSACFGAPFMPLHPTVYGEMLAAKLRDSGARAWLLNTGWSGGAYGTGKRIDIGTTRKILSAVLDGSLYAAATRLDGIFGFSVPLSVEGVDPKVLNPRLTWKDPDAYDRKAIELAGLFKSNFEKFGAGVSTAGGPS